MSIKEASDSPSSSHSPIKQRRRAVRRSKTTGDIHRSSAHSSKSHKHLTAADTTTKDHDDRRSRRSQKDPVEPDDSRRQQSPKKLTRRRAVSSENLVALIQDKASSSEPPRRSLSSGEHRYRLGTQSCLEDPAHSHTAKRITAQRSLSDSLDSFVSTTTRNTAITANQMKFDIDSPHPRRVNITDDALTVDTNSKTDEQKAWAGIANLLNYDCASVQSAEVLPVEILQALRRSGSAIAHQQQQQQQRMPDLYNASISSLDEDVQSVISYIQTAIVQPQHAHNGRNADSATALHAFLGKMILALQEQPSDGDGEKANGQNQQQKLFELFNWKQNQNIADEPEAEADEGSSSSEGSQSASDVSHDDISNDDSPEQLQHQQKQFSIESHKVTPKNDGATTSAKRASDGDLGYSKEIYHYDEYGEDEVDATLEYVDPDKSHDSTHDDDEYDYYYGDHNESQTTANMSPVKKPSTSTHGRVANSLPRKPVVKTQSTRTQQRVASSTSPRQPAVKKVSSRTHERVANSPPHDPTQQVDSKQFDRESPEEKPPRSEVASSPVAFTDYFPKAAVHPHEGEIVRPTTPRTKSGSHIRTSPNKFLSQVRFASLRRFNSKHSPFLSLRSTALSLFHKKQPFTENAGRCEAQFFPKTLLECDDVEDELLCGCPCILEP
jgi:hypothetical protein